MILPPFLKKGDTIAILSTARKINEKQLLFAKRFLEAQGYSIIFGNSIGESHHQFAGNDKQRASDFDAAVANPNIKAIWCARGGYGTVRIIDLINTNAFIENPKWIIGYSDVTVLHAKINHLGVASLHAPMAFDIENTLPSVQENFKHILEGNIASLAYDASRNNKIGKAFGQAIGGNLSVIYSMCGTAEKLETTGKILFLEDLDEYLYHIDRMIQNLKRNGYLSDLSALVVGGMTKIHDNQIPFGYTVEEIILEATKEYHYPIVFNAPFGHIKENQPIILGQTYYLHATTEKVILKAKNY